MSLPLPLRRAFEFDEMFATTVSALAPHSSRAAASSASLAATKAGLFGSIKTTALNLGSVFLPLISPAAAWKMSAHCRRTFFRITGLLDAKFDAILISDL